MSRTYTERELREHQRAAFVVGAGWAKQRGTDLGAGGEATFVYPLSQITRPRVIEIGSNRYRYRNGVVEFEIRPGDWIPSSFNGTRLVVKDMTPDLAREWIEILRLIQNPTETVDG